MEEVLIQILLMVAEVFFEALLELGGEALLDVLSRVAADVFKPVEPPHPVLSCLVWGFLGAAVGAMSLVFLPHPLFHRSKFHGISLIVSPIAAGTAMSALGAMLRRRGKQVVQIESFPYAFAFALGMALVRLAWSSRCACWSWSAATVVIYAHRWRQGERDVVHLVRPHSHDLSRDQQLIS